MQKIFLHQGQTIIMSECVNNHQLDADHFACFSFVLATLD